jgi:hypothetical protein
MVLLLLVRITDTATTDAAAAATTDMSTASTRCRFALMADIHTYKIGMIIILKLEN